MVRATNGGGEARSIADIVILERSAPPEPVIHISAPPIQVSSVLIFILEKRRINKFFRYKVKNLDSFDVLLILLVNFSRCYFSLG